MNKQQEDIIFVGKKEPLLSEEERIQRQKILDEIFIGAFNEENEDDDL